MLQNMMPFSIPASNLGGSSNVVEDVGGPVPGPRRGRPVETSATGSVSHVSNTVMHTWQTCLLLIQAKDLHLVNPN
jgi:hypothetical protein